MSKRRKFSEEFMREAVGLTRQPGADVGHAASARLGIREQSIHEVRPQGAARHPASIVATPLAARLRSSAWGSAAATSIPCTRMWQANAGALP